MSLVNITENFTWNEAKCHDGTKVPSELVSNAEELAKNLEIIRAEAGGVPLHVVSWYRTPEYNKKVKGASRSQHLKAKAADLVHRNMRPAQLYALIERLITERKIKQGGVGLYNSFVHYDIRGYKARWDNAI